MPSPFKVNIETATLKNKYYRRILTTTDEMQLVVMHLQKHEEIGEEVHPITSQFFRVESGSGLAIVNGKKFRLALGSAIVVPSGKKHNIIAGENGLSLYTIYSPPIHYNDDTQKRKTAE